MPDEKLQAIGELEAILLVTMRSLFWQAGKSPLSDLSLEQMRMVRILEPVPQMRVSQLAAELKMTPSAVTQMSYRLRDLKLVEREEVEGDGRGRGIALSENGREQLRLRSEMRVQHASKILESVPTESLQALLRALHEVLGQLPEVARAESLEFLAAIEQSQNKPA